MELTAEDLWPIVAQLTPEERIRLIRLTLARGAREMSDAEAYRLAPIGKDEFTDHCAEDALAWDADGWDDLE